MKPAPFDIVRAASLAETSRHLRESDGAGRPVAGAQSLGPMLNLRLARPKLLVDLTGIPELTRIIDNGDTVTVGACVTTANIEDGRLPGRGLEHLSAVAAHIAYRAVRNRGTIGGSLCHADPSADWVSVLCALGADCHITGAGGMRRIPADQFVTGAYETALAPDEVLEAITLPRLSARARFGYFKVCRKTGEFASAMSAVLNDPERGLLRVVIGATKGRPIVIADGREISRGAAGIDETAVLTFLDRHGISDHAIRSQQVAALARAHAQAVHP